MRFIPFRFNLRGSLLALAAMLLLTVALDPAAALLRFAAGPMAWSARSGPDAAPAPLPIQPDSALAAFDTPAAGRPHPGRAWRDIEPDTELGHAFAAELAMTGLPPVSAVRRRPDPSGTPAVPEPGSLAPFAAAVAAALSRGRRGRLRSRRRRDR